MSSGEEDSGSSENLKQRTISESNTASEHSLPKPRRAYSATELDHLILKRKGDKLILNNYSPRLLFGKRSSISTILEEEPFVHKGYESEAEERTKTRSREPVDKFTLVMLTLAMAGIQCCYAVQIGHGSPTLEQLGLPTELVSLAWLAGPLSGIIVQPIIGILSDSCQHPFGRRRPFLIVGTIFTSLALSLLGNADIIGFIFGDSSDSQPVGLAIAISAFFLLDFSIQAIQAPLRALLTDIVPEEQQAQGNALFAMMTGIGNLVGTGMGSLQLSSIFPFFVSDSQALFTLAALILIITIVLCCYYVRETPIGAMSRSESFAQRFRSDQGIVKLLVNAPRPFWRVFIVQLFTWYGFFTVFVYASVWVGRNVYSGNGAFPLDSPQRQAYDEGVRLGNLGLSLDAAVAMGYSIVLPYLIEKYGMGSMYCFSQLVEAFCLIVPFFIRGPSSGHSPSLILKLVTLSILALFGIPWSSTMTIPWALMGTAVYRVDPNRIGLYSTFFNLSQSGPQLLVSLGSPRIVRKTGDVSVVLLLGGLSALISASLVYILRVYVLENDELPSAPQVLLDEQSRFSE
jgi:solute carrier family 45 protein 1/2/4